MYLDRYLLPFAPVKDAVAIIERTGKNKLQSNQGPLIGCHFLPPDIIVGMRHIPVFGLSRSSTLYGWAVLVALVACLWNISTLAWLSKPAYGLVAWSS